MGYVKIRKNKISRLSVVDQVCEAIKADLAAKVWQVGDRLPSESELADMFGVNRLSVRMALQKLSTLGFIETRVGEGSFVTEFSMQPFLLEVAGVYKDEKRRNDVEQLRNLLEGECMSIAILEATEEEKNRLKEKLEQYFEKEAVYNQNIKDDEALDELVNADFAFHYEIINISHNHIYMDVYAMVQQLIREHIKYLISTRARRREEAGLMALDHKDDKHLQMYESIVNGDIEEARRSRELILGIRPIHGMDYFDQADES